MVTYDVPFVPTSDNHTKIMIKLAHIRPGERAIDLGAGDGKLVMAMAKAGAYTTGVEIDEERAKAARTFINMNGMRDKASVIQGNFWEQNLEDYDLIMLYGVPSIMERLQEKIINEAKNTVRIVSNHFEFPGWTAVKIKNDVYLYHPFKNIQRASKPEERAALNS